eukprot:tig00001098_g7072.t1
MGAITSRRARVEPTTAAAVEPDYVTIKPVQRPRQASTARAGAQQSQVPRPDNPPGELEASGATEGVGVVSRLGALKEQIARYIQEYEPREGTVQERSAWYSRYSAKEGYRLLLSAGLSLPALVALVNHDRFARRCEEWAPALLALALSELADRGAIRLEPSNGVANGDLAALDFVVVLVRSGVARVRSPLLNDLLRFLRASGGAASAAGLCRAYLAVQDIGVVHAGHGGGCSRMAWVVAAELADAGLKRTLRSAVSAPRIAPEAAAAPPHPRGAPSSVGALLGRRSGSLDQGSTLVQPLREALKRPTAPLTEEGKQAGVGAVVYARAVHEAERWGGALSALAPAELEAFLADRRRQEAGGGVGVPGALLGQGLALPAGALGEQRGRLARRAARRGPRANVCRALPGLARDSLGHAELLSRLLCMNHAGEAPWQGDLPWQHAWGFDFYADRDFSDADHDD